MTERNIRDEVRKVRIEALKRHLKFTRDCAGSARDDNRMLAAEFLLQKIELIKAAIKLEENQT